MWACSLPAGFFLPLKKPDLRTVLSGPDTFGWSAISSILAIRPKWRAGFAAQLARLSCEATAQAAARPAKSLASLVGFERVRRHSHHHDEPVSALHRLLWSSRFWVRVPYSVRQCAASAGSVYVRTIQGSRSKPLQVEERLYQFATPLQRSNILSPPPNTFGLIHSTVPEFASFTDWRTFPKAEFSSVR